MSIIYFPKSLKIGDTIGITALSSGKTDEEDSIILENATKKFNNEGFKVIETPNVRTNQKLVSSSPKERSKEFFDLWLDSNVSYILSFGGEFLMEVLPYIDAGKLMSVAPKWVQGYSDVSLFNFYLTTNYNIATIHSYSFSAYGKNEYDESTKLVYDFVMDSENMLTKSFIQNSYGMYASNSHSLPGAEVEIPKVTERVQYKNLMDVSTDMNQKVCFSGRLIGGCIDVLKVIVGTSFDNTKNFCKSMDEGAIWYLENCEMSVADLKRALWQMKSAGWFENANGFIIGRTSSKESIYDFTYEDALKDVLSKLNVPAIYDVDFGHTFPQWTLINGAMAEFSYSSGKGKIKISEK